MLNVLGVGYAFPTTVLNNQILAEITGSVPEAPVAAQSNGILSRFSSLPLEYLKETGNQDLRSAYAAATDTPTDLGLRAAQMALARAGVAESSIGLIIADTSTPRQTIPAEATRIGKRLGLKVPAYDVLASSASLPAHLELLEGWKDERIPDYVLCVSTNTPTQHLNYRAQGEAAETAWSLGDGASAVLLSARKPGRLTIKNSFFGSAPALAKELSVPVYEPITFSGDAYETVYKPYLKQMFEKAVRDNNLDPSKIFFIGPQRSYRELKRFCEEAEVNEMRHWHNVERCGDTFGAAAGAVLAEHWEETEAGQEILIITVGPGVGFGYVLLQASTAGGRVNRC